LTSCCAPSQGCRATSVVRTVFVGQNVINSC
jgi:hypothetical protein